MQTPTELKYSATHQWARLESDGTVVIGITDYAQNELGDVVFVEAPRLGDKMSAGEQICIVESVKTASEVYAPISGEIVAVNAQLDDHPEWVNDDVYGQAWFCRMNPSDPEELKQLMDAEAYQAHTE